jgi:hypothetical protein
MTSSARRFARHYAEMVAAMYLGMLLLLPIGALGVELHDDATLMLSAMAVTMTAPMVAWMRYRGHGWASCVDMTAAMLVPTLGVLVLGWIALVEDVGALMLVEHVAMLPSMLVAMLLHRREYVGSPACAIR